MTSQCNEFMSKREKELVDDDWLSINVFREKESIRGQFNGHYLWELYFRERERERERVFWWGDRKMVLFLDDIKDFYSDIGR